ncbi:Adenosylhomocysteinase [Streptomyces misionensis JCM 4497]
MGRPRGGHHHRRRRPLRGRAGLRAPLDVPARRPEPPPAAVPDVPAHPAPHRRRAAALRGPLRPARAQGRPDRRARPLRHPGGLLARVRHPGRRRAGGHRGVSPAPGTGSHGPKDE